MAALATARGRHAAHDQLAWYNRWMSDRGLYVKAAGELTDPLVPN